jgi:hypothetical protein
VFWHNDPTLQIVSRKTYNDNQWHFLADTYSNGVETLYIDSQRVGSQSVLEYGCNGDPSEALYSLGSFRADDADVAWPNLNSATQYFNGALDEVRISNSARSGGWIAAEYNNQSSPSTFYSVGAETVIANGLLPPAATLWAAQTQQFTAVMGSACNAPVTWSLQPAIGAITQAGRYTAPASITGQQTVQVIAKSQSDGTQTAAALVTLNPPISVTVTPAAATLYPGQTQQFAASVANVSNTAVKWAIATGGSGSIDGASGIYSAPVTVMAQQTATITATSLADGTTQGSAAITVIPYTPTYSYHRAIVIDHTKVPNTDQSNFPVAVSGTYPYLATIAN